MIVPAPYRWMALCAVAAAPLAGCNMSWSYDHEATKTVELSAPATGSMSLTGSVGDILITGDPGATEVHAIVELVGSGTTLERAEQALADLDAVMAVEGGVLTVRLDHPPEGDGKQYGARWNLVVPADTILEVLSDVGEVVVVGMAGPVDARTDVGDVHVATEGDVIARADVGDVGAISGGAVDIRVDVGTVRVRRTGDTDHAIDIRVDVGGITVSTPGVWSGDMDLATDVGDVSLFGGHGGVRSGTEADSFRRVDNASGATMIRLRTDVGDVNLRVTTDTDTPPEPPTLNVPTKEPE